MQAWWKRLSSQLRLGPECEPWLSRQQTLELLDMLADSTELGAGSYGTVFGQQRCGIAVKLTFDPDGEQEKGLRIGAQHGVGCKLLSKLGLNAATLFSYNCPREDLRAAIARTCTHFRRAGDDLARWNGFSALVLERLDTDLQNFLEAPSCRLKSADLCTQVLEPVLGRLGALSKLGWFFHDAKPSNILLDLNKNNVVYRVLLGDLDMGCLSELKPGPDYGDALVAYVASVSPDALTAATSQLSGWDANRFWKAWRLALGFFIEGLGSDGGRYWRLYALSQLSLPEKAILCEVAREPEHSCTGTDPDRLRGVLRMNRFEQEQELLSHFSGDTKKPVRTLREALRLRGPGHLTLYVLSWLAKRRRDPVDKSVRVLRWALGNTRCNRVLYAVVAARLAGLTGWSLPTTQ